jgi:hypothetical protein
MALHDRMYLLGEEFRPCPDPEARLPVVPDARTEGSGVPVAAVLAETNAATDGRAARSSVPRPPRTGRSVPTGPRAFPSAPETAQRPVCG